MKTQPAGNYTYDAIGNLTGDNQEGIGIDWTVYGKIHSITNTDATKNIAYIYDAAGHRAGKTINPTGGNAAVSTWYVRDAQGNPLALYDNTGGIYKQVVSDYGIKQK